MCWAPWIPDVYFYDVRYFPKGIFPSGNFPMVCSHVIFSQVCPSCSTWPCSPCLPTALGPRCSLWRLRRPKLTLEKLPQGKLHIWKWLLGKLPDTILTNFFSDFIDGKFQAGELSPKVYKQLKGNSKKIFAKKAHLGKSQSNAELENLVVWISRSMLDLDVY